MKITYITQHTRVNLDLEQCILTNGERADARLALCFAPAYEDGCDLQMTAFYITSNGDPYPLAVENEDGVFFGQAAFGGVAADYSRECSDWLTPEALEGWFASQRTRQPTDGHAVIRLADALRAVRDDA